MSQDRTRAGGLQILLTARPAAIAAATTGGSSVAVAALAEHLRRAAGDHRSDASN
jgi:hypothetical protein